MLKGFDRDLFGEKRSRRRRAAWLGLPARCFLAAWIWRACEDVPPEHDAQSDPVNIKLDTLLDRWYKHLLVFILVFCPYLFYHSLHISRRAQPRASSIICARSTYTRFNLRLS
jgi:hypothetical protein